MKKMKSKQKTTRFILLSLIGTGLLIILCLLFLPFSRFHIGHNLAVRMRINVNGESVTPYNITCVREESYDAPLRIRSKDEYTDISTEAAAYSGYTISYDVDTPDGAKHLSFMILKTHMMGPRDSFAYEIDLDKDQESGDWRARVWLDRPNAESKITEIWLSEDEHAHVQYGS